ncbi:MAG: V-type ATP synthase subunit I [Candidatus Diapherotrites archaeon]
MKKFSVILLEEDTQKVLDDFHEEELVEFKRVDIEGKNLNAFDFNERERFASFQLTRAKRILGFFKAHSEPQSLKEKIKEFLSTREPLKEKAPADFNSFKKSADEFLGGLASKIEALDSRLKKAEERSIAIQKEKLILESIQELGIELDLLAGYKSISVVVGKIPPEFEDELLAFFKKQKQASLLKITESVGEKTVLFSVETEAQESIMQSLKKIGFDRLIVPERSGKPANLIRKAEKELRQLEEEKKAIVLECRQLEKKHAGRVSVLQELLEIEKSKGKAFQMFARTQKTVFFEAFVPEKLENRFREKIEKNTKGRHYIEEMQFKEEEAPVMLENKGYFKNYEFLVKMYGLPEYGSIDPTFFIAILYPVFFGIAFSDIGYGFVLLAISLFLKHFLGKKSDSWKQLSSILVHGSIATIFFGWVFGGFFGDLGGESMKKIALLDPFGKTLEGQSIALLFIGAMILVGLLHLTLAIVLGFKEELRKKNYKAALEDKMVYLLLEGGIALYAIGTILPGQEIAILAGLCLLLASLALMLLSGGPLGLMKITGFMGNTLSYLRLMVLSLATFAVAMSINIIAKLFFDIPYIGFALWAIIMVFGHTANLVFNILSSFIHPLRLHFVEFFSFFYAGNGKEFKPFHVPRKITKKTEVQKNG